ncbi:MAG: hypothetical protein WCZ23_10210 [Rhodospirillaceae bacterium]
MRALVAAVAVALIVGTEVTAGMAVLDGVIFWSNMSLALKLLWIAPLVGIASGLWAGAHVLRRERAFPPGI